MPDLNRYKKRDNRFSIKTHTSYRPERRLIECNLQMSDEGNTF